MLKDDSLLDLDAFEEILAGALSDVFIGKKLLLHDLLVAAFDVVVAPNEIEAIVEEELLHQRKDVAVLASDHRKVPVLRELVAGADLDIGVAVLVIPAKGVEKKELIVGEVVRPAVVAPVAIAEEDEF